MRRCAIACVFLLRSAVCTGQDLSFGTRQARPVPEWLNRTNIYEVWLNAFSSGGTLKDAVPRLPYLPDLGVGIVYLEPIAKISGKRGASPYNVADYNTIDPEFGTEADLREFVATTHKLG